jgi:hypothetical protein
VDLQTLHERTGISKRKLRYCVDHKLIPELDIELAVDETGRPRKFAEDVGFGIVCAAALLQLGLPHDTIRLFLKGLLDITLGGDGPKKRALVAVLERDASAVAHLGDGVNVRLVVEEYDYDSGWFAPGNPAPLAKEYKPVVTVTLNLGKIRDHVFGRQEICS